MFDRGILFRSVAVTGLVGLAAAFAIGCGPTPKPLMPDQPKTPKFRYESIEEATVTPVTLNSHRSGQFEIRQTRDTIANMSFQGHGSGAGALVADSFILDLQRRGNKVIEREKIEQIIREQQRQAAGFTDLTDVEIARRIGKLVRADYFLVGAVTEYASESRDVPLTKVVLQSDVQRYQEESEVYESKRPDFEKECKSYMENPYNRQYGAYPKCDMPEAKTIDDWQEEYYSQHRTALASVARVGLTAKLISIATTEILWVGQANVNDSNLQKGMTRITSKMINDILVK